MSDTPAHPVVLVIDDHEAIRLAIQRILEGAGYAVLTAGNGVEGLNMLMARKGDVGGVVLDLYMPKLDGAHFAELIRIAWPDMPILVISAYADAARTVTERLHLSVLPKPFTVDNLVQAVGALVRS